jgi:hypothetical protein
VPSTSGPSTSRANTIKTTKSPTKTASPINGVSLRRKVFAIVNLTKNVYLKACEESKVFASIMRPHWRPY